MLDSCLLENFYQEKIPIQMKAPGTCGELIQGAIAGNDFLVNCPINRFSCAKLSEQEESGIEISNPQRHRKIQQVTKLISSMFRLPYNHLLEIDSDIPVGKGMASSSADITAAIAVITRHFGIQINHQFLAKIATQIEPSDCVHFPNISQVNHLSGDLIDTMPAPIGLRTLVVDCGGTINTLAFDREFARYIYHENQPIMTQALSLLKTGLRTGDNKKVAAAATMSATLNQEILNKPPFEDLLALTTQQGALGVNCAHSGTVLGVFYEPSSVQKDELINAIEQQFCNDLTIIGDHSIIGGCYFGS